MIVTEQSQLYFWKTLNEKTFSACRPLYPVSAYNDMSDVCGQAEDGVERHLVRRCQSHTGKPK